MDHIETAILNCYGIREAEQNMVFAARLTQHGHRRYGSERRLGLFRTLQLFECNSGTHEL